MAVTFSDDGTVTVVGNYSFEDIYQEAINQDKSNIVQKLEDTYVFSNNLIIGDKSTDTIIKDTNKTIIINGELLQVLRNSVLQIGDISDSGFSINGCYLKVPNIKLAYGFGDKDKNDPGSFIAYDSKIDIPGFWSFFGGSDTLVIVKDCYIKKGFGRIEGNNSILENLNFQESHGRYGILTPKGILKSFKNISAGDAEVYTKNDKDYTAQLYYNASISGDLIVDGGKFRGYGNLIFCDKYEGTITLLDVDYDTSKPLRYLYSGSDNLNDLYVKYRFSPIFLDKDENPIKTSVKITDVNNTEIFNGESDDSGKLETQLIYGYSDKTDENITYYYPYDIQLDYSIDGESFTTNKRYSSGKPLLNIPIYLEKLTGGSSNGDNSSSNDGCSCDSIDNLLGDLETRLTDKLNTLESGIKQVVREVTDEVNENEVYIKETGFSIVI